MPSEYYRYYRLDGAGEFHDPQWIEARNDRDAIAQVGATQPDETWELWQGTRLVGKLWPKRLSA